MPKYTDMVETPSPPITSQKTARSKKIATRKQPQNKGNKLKIKLRGRLLKKGKVEQSTDKKPKDLSEKNAPDVGSASEKRQD